MDPVRLIAPLAVAALVAHPGGHSPLSSRELWATVDVCNPRDQPDTIGIRGSMPGDSHARDTMYMRFQVQYQEAASGHWVSIARGADSGLVKVGPAGVARQAGHSFQFAPAGAGRPVYKLRGLVGFQWRRGAKVLMATTRTTTAGHRSLAGADPRGFSAATCRLS